MQYQGILLAVNVCIVMIAFLALRGKTEKLKLILITTLFAYFLAGILPYLLAWISFKWIILFYAIAIAVALIVIDFILSEQNDIDVSENDKIDVIATEAHQTRNRILAHKEDLVENLFMSSELDTPVEKPGQAADKQPEVITKLALRIGSRQMKAAYDEFSATQDHNQDYRQITNQASTVVYNVETTSEAKQALPETIDDKEAAWMDTVTEMAAPLVEESVEEEFNGSTASVLEEQVAVIRSLDEDNVEIVEIALEDSDLDGLAIKKEENEIEEETLNLETSGEPEEKPLDQTDTFQEATLAFNEKDLQQTDIDTLIDMAFQAKFKDDYAAAIRIFELVLRRNPPQKIASLIIDDVEIMQNKIA